MQDLIDRRQRKIQDIQNDKDRSYKENKMQAIERDEIDLKISKMESKKAQLQDTIDLLNLEIKQLSENNKEIEEQISLNQAEKFQ